MSLAMLDACHRMADYLTAADLNTEACVNLAATILEEQANELAHAALKAENNSNADNWQRLVYIKSFYESDMFAALSCGLVDGTALAQNIIKQALQGRTVRMERRTQ